MIGALVAASVLLAATPTVEFRITDPRIAEASGIAAGQRTPGVYYVQNDSGDSNRFFALNARTGATAATITVPGAENVDWEDLAVATDDAGTPSIWLADTGDNAGQRSEVRIYRVDEPRLDPTADDRAVTTSRPDVYRLRYPGGPVDTESLAVGPDGAAYLVTKSIIGSSVVYRVPPRPDADHVQLLRRVADVRFGLTGTPGGPNAVGQLTATGAALSRDGSVLVIRTYTDAYAWAVTAGDVAAALRRPPTRTALPRQPQGEGIAIVGSTLLIDSEGRDQPVYSQRVELPSADTPAPSPVTRTNGVIVSESPDEPDAGDRSGSDTWRYLVGGVAVIVLGLAVTLIYRRRAKRG